MTQVDLQKLTVGLSRTWSGYLRDWDRSLRSGNYPQTTCYNYLLAAAQLGRNLVEHSPDPDADAAGADPAGVTRSHVESFQAWMITTRSPSTAVNKHKGLQQFFKFHAASQGLGRAQALGLLVRAAVEAADVMKSLGFPAEAWLGSERAHQAAIALEDPVMWHWPRSPVASHLLTGGVTPTPTSGSWPGEFRGPAGAGLRGGRTRLQGRLPTACVGGVPHRTPAGPASWSSCARPGAGTRPASPAHASAAERLRINLPPVSGPR